MWDPTPAVQVDVKIKRRKIPCVNKPDVYTGPETPRALRARRWDEVLMSGPPVRLELKRPINSVDLSQHLAERMFRMSLSADLLKTGGPEIRKVEKHTVSCFAASPLLHFHLIGKKGGKKKEKRLSHD